MYSKTQSSSLLNMIKIPQTPKPDPIEITIVDIYRYLINNSAVRFGALAGVAFWSVVTILNILFIVGSFFILNIR